MRIFNSFFISFLLIINIAWASEKPQSIVSPPPYHLGPEGLPFNQRMIQNALDYLKEKRQKNIDKSELYELTSLENLLFYGKKACLWINAINSKLDPKDHLDLSSPTQSGGIPYHSPMITSTKILEERFIKFQTEASPSTVNVILNSTTLPLQAPADVDSDTFLKELRTLDRIYQATIRWTNQLDWLSYYANKIIFDVRGFIFFKSLSNPKEYLTQFDTYSPEDKKNIESHLLGLCLNGDFDRSDCLDELKIALAKKRLFSFYERFNRYGQKIYDLFFTIKKTRPEIFWQENEIKAFFQEPNNTVVQNWLAKNIQEEWQFDQRFLSLTFETQRPELPKIEFLEGVTAHVNEIAGNLITMEAEYPIESPDQKWTIRHEFGHILGFEDCYLEFYDTSSKSMVYYEIDVDNIMCSRNGHIKETHFNNLNLSYSKKIRSYSR